MSRAEFMNELKYLLQDITDSEREEALQYYEDYFDDAGEDNEDAIIRELGSPERVAAIIKSGLMGNDEDAGEFTERGYEDWRFKQDYQVPERTYGRKSNNAYTYGNGDRTDVSPRTRRTGNNSLGKILLIIVIAMVAIPIIISAAGGIFGVIVGILGGLVGIVVGIIGATLGGVLGGLAVFVGGIIRMFTSPASGFFLCASGLLLIAFGFLALVFAVYVATKLIPRFVRWIARLFRRIFHRRENA